MINQDVSIWSVQRAVDKVKLLTGIKVSKRQVSSIMKGKFRLSFRRVKRVVNAGNSERNLVLRSLYAQKMLQIYGQGKHVVNIDESWIPETDFRRRRWATKGGHNSMAEKTMGHRVNMIVAVSSKGHVWLSLTQCNTDENVMQMFLSHLAKALTKEFSASWRQEIVLLMDGASYHRSAATRACISHLGMQVVLSAPYSYAAAPAETWFAHFKRGDFNQRDIKTTKK